MCKLTLSLSEPAALHAEDNICTVWIVWESCWFICIWYDQSETKRATIEAGEGRVDRHIRLRNVFQYDPRSLAESEQHHTHVMALMQSGALERREGVFT
jgi:hypothetical protein